MYFKKRYIFDVDPVSDRGWNKERIFYEIYEGYYSNNKTAKELIEEGIKFNEKGYYSNICTRNGYRYSNKYWDYYINECHNMLKKLGNDKDFNKFKIYLDDRNISCKYS